LLLLGSTILGATILREPVAWAAAPIASVFVTNDASSPVPVREQNLDANGNLKVHEQGMANVSVNGVVATQPSDPSNSFSLTSLVNGGLGTVNDLEGCDQSLPTGTRWFISSLATISNSSTGGLLALGLYRRADTSGNPVVAGPVVPTRSGETVQLTFPRPYVLTSARDGLCLKSVVAGDGVETIIVGYRK
jgi:hypothetical protein